MANPVANADSVEDALARALTQASISGRFDIVAQLADELRARRLDRDGVADLECARRVKAR